MQPPNHPSRKLLLDAKTLVIKVGSRVLTDKAGRLDLAQVGELSRQLVKLVDDGKQVVLVSSGAVASGISKLGLTKRPASLAKLQAVAAVGQAQLIQSYEGFFSELNRHAAQILLIADDLDDRTRYLHVRNTLLALLKMGVIPIINENDSVAVEELQTTFGDNDRLAATVAGLFRQPALIILSDVEGVYDRDPEAADAQLIHTVESTDVSVMRVAVRKTSGVGRGGMSSKLKSARLVTRSGAPVVIAGGRVENILLRLLEGEMLGTYFSPDEHGLVPRKRWIGTAQSVGTLVVDAGAVTALLSGGPSLLAIGIVDVKGVFTKGEVVAICGPDQMEIARGLCNYNSKELLKIRGLKSRAIKKALGRCPYREVVHRDNMTISHPILDPA